MPINVVLEDERAKPIDSIVDPRGDLMKIWPFLEPCFPLLQYLDPFGDAVFNRLQMDEVLRELESMRARATCEESMALIDEIIALAARCKDDIHTYLRFLGD